MMNQSRNRTTMDSWDVQALILPVAAPLLRLPLTPDQHPHLRLLIRALLFKMWLLQRLVQALPLLSQVEE